MPNDVYIVTRAELESLADKIRSKTGESANIEWLSGFENEIDKLSLPQPGSQPLINVIESHHSFIQNCIYPITVTETINQ